MKVANIDLNIHLLFKMIIVLSNTKKLVESIIQGQETSLMVRILYQIHLQKNYKMTMLLIRLSTKIKNALMNPKEKLLKLLNH